MLCSNIYHYISKYTTSSLKKEPATMLACSQLRSVLSFTLNLTHLQANSNTLECVREGALLAAKHNSHKILSFLRASTAYCVCAFVCLCSSRICTGQTEWGTETASAAVNAVSIFSEATFRQPSTQPGHCCACFHSSELLCWGTRSFFLFFCHRISGLPSCKNSVQCEISPLGMRGQQWLEVRAL